MAWITPRFLRMHFDGAWMALGGSEFRFHREIPALARYRIRTGVAGWDDKWLYVVGRFVSPSRRPSRPWISCLKTYAQSVIQPTKPGSSPSPPPNDPTTPAAPLPTEDDLDETLYCTSVSRYCFKSGRRTIPPWLVLASSGYGTWASTRTNWTKAESLRTHSLHLARRRHRAETGRDLPRDGIVAGGGYRQAGFLARYRLESERSGLEDERWMDSREWCLDEWEERRREGLRRVGSALA